MDQTCPVPEVHTLRLGERRELSNGVAGVIHAAALAVQTATPGRTE